MKEDFPIEFIGAEENVQNAFDHIQCLFSTVRYHIFNDEHLDEKSKTKPISSKNLIR